MHTFSSPKGVILMSWQKYGLWDINTHKLTLSVSLSHAHTHDHNHKHIYTNLTHTFTLLHRNWHTGCRGVSRATNFLLTLQIRHSITHLHTLAHSDTLTNAAETGGVCPILITIFQHSTRWLSERALPRKGMRYCLVFRGDGGRQRSGWGRGQTGRVHV